MTVLVVSLFLLFGTVELRRVWEEVALEVSLDRAARAMAAADAAMAAADEQRAGAIAAAAAADRARLAFAIRCSCEAPLGSDR